MYKKGKTMEYAEHMNYVQEGQEYGVCIRRTRTWSMYKKDQSM